MLRKDAQLAEMKSSLCEPLTREDCATAQSFLVLLYKRFRYKYEGFPKGFPDFLIAEGVLFWKY